MGRKMSQPGTSTENDRVCVLSTVGTVNGCVFLCFM